MSRHGIACLASGRLDALITPIGVRADSPLFAVMYPALEGYLSSDQGLATLPKVLGVHHWTVLDVLEDGMFIALKRFKKRRGRS